jgi:type II secretory pathway pseudopilin PulG
MVSRRNQEGGFALLLVFLMAAIIGITLYMELPRIAFESQRQKEQLLMERGEQYQIAIRRYMQKGLKAGMMQGPPPTWPGKIEDLENTNGRRFLRKRYIDPMTGKEEWRLIHINGGVLTDSVNNKPNNTQQAAQSQAGQGITEFTGLGQSAAGSTAQGLAAINRRRPSDSNPAGGDPGSQGTGGSPLTGAGAPPPGALPPGASGGPMAPGAVAGPPPGMPIQLGGTATAMGGPVPPGQLSQTGQPVQPFPGTVQLPNGQQQPGANPSAGSSGGGNSFSGVTSSFGSPGSPTTPAGQPIYAGQLPPGVPGAPANSQFPGGVSPYPIVPGANGLPPGFPQPGTSTNGQPLTPGQLLNTLLTTPRPGGMPTAVPTPGSIAIGGGIAGFASTLDADSIMVCADHSNYKEWEFLFDPSKWKGPANPNTQLGGTPSGSNKPSTAGNSFGNSSSGGSTSGGSGSGGSGSGGAASGNFPTGNSGPGVLSGPGGTPVQNIGGVPAAGSPGANRGTQGQGMGQMPGGQGNFGSVCGMEARPGHQ